MGRTHPVGPDSAISGLGFLEHALDRDGAEEWFARVGQRIREELVAWDPDAPGYVKMPLEFAPHPETMARRLFDDQTIERHLEALARRQEPDGGWPITWETPRVAAVAEWRAFMTVKWLDVLENYGRLAGQTATIRPLAKK